MQYEDTPSAYDPWAWAGDISRRQAVVRAVRQRAPTGVMACYDKTPIRFRRRGRWDEFIHDELSLRSGYHCARCPATTALQIDHVIPLSQNGRHAIDNMQLLCPPCHRAKTTEDRRNA